MSDVHSKQVRSYNMSRIKSKNTKPELIVRKFLHSLGFRFRIHVKRLAGTPDIVLTKYKTAIFVHGCFWHGHSGCRYYVVPKTRTDWWLAKINNNISRYQNSKNTLLAAGWKVIEVWECDLKNKNLVKSLSLLVDEILGNFSESDLSQNENN
ncbi:very short patch repair endonuclease [Pedobacter agri]|uniref:very short patch repair endonuclease n=1 Tax=Pedobacter agri TaxID=454586 RepID=UPI00292CC0DD|nr:very short patch repair endonuclease [Pedobacter agri]